MREREHELPSHTMKSIEARFPAGQVMLDGNLTLPAAASGVVLFAHGSGSSRFSARNNFVARVLNGAWARCSSTC